MKKYMVEKALNILFGRIEMGRKALNKFGMENCSPILPCEACLAFIKAGVFDKCYPKGCDPRPVTIYDPSQVIDI